MSCFFDRFCQKFYLEIFGNFFLTKMKSWFKSGKFDNVRAPWSGSAFRQVLSKILFRNFWEFFFWQKWNHDSNLGNLMTCERPGPEVHFDRFCQKFYFGIFGIFFLTKKKSWFKSGKFDNVRAPGFGSAFRIAAGVLYCVYSVNNITDSS